MEWTNQQIEIQVHEDTQSEKIGWSSARGSGKDRRVSSAIGWVSFDFSKTTRVSRSIAKRKALDRSITVSV